MSATSNSPSTDAVTGMAKIDPLERNLISLVGTMVNLEKNRKLLETRPILPKHMEAIMAPAKPAIDNILASVIQAQVETQKLAEKWITKWMDTLPARVGGTFGCTFSARKGEAAITGRVHAAKLGNRLVTGEVWRAVEITLYPFDIQLTGSWKPSVALDSGSSFEDYTDIKEGLLKDTFIEDGGAREPALVLMVPIHKAVRDRMSRRYESIKFL